MLKETKIWEFDSEGWREEQALRQIVLELYGGFGGYGVDIAEEKDDPREIESQHAIFKERRKTKKQKQERSSEVALFR